MLALFLVCYSIGFLIVFDDAARCFRTDPDRLGAFIACAFLGLFWTGVLYEDTCFLLAQAFKKKSKRSRWINRSS